MAIHFPDVRSIFPLRTQTVTTATTFGHLGLRPLTMSTLHSVPL